MAGDGLATIEEGDLHALQVSLEPLKLVVNLCERTSAARGRDKTFYQAHPSCSDAGVYETAQPLLSKKHHHNQINCIPRIGRRHTWNASSRVWQRTRAWHSPALGSSCCSTDSTNTAVLPMPDLAWQRTSRPRIAWGMHSCWTALGGGGKMPMLTLRSYHQICCEAH